MQAKHLKQGHIMKDKVINEIRNAISHTLKVYLLKHQVFPEELKDEIIKYLRLSVINFSYCEINYGSEMVSFFDEDEDCYILEKNMYDIKKEVIEPLKELLGKIEIEKPLNVNFDADLRILTLNDNIYSGASRQFVFSSSKNNVSFNSMLICTSLLYKDLRG